MLLLQLLFPTLLLNFLNDLYLIIKELFILSYHGFLDHNFSELKNYIIYDLIYNLVPDFRKKFLYINFTIISIKVFALLIFLLLVRELLKTFIKSKSFWALTLWISLRFQLYAREIDVTPPARYANRYKSVKNWVEYFLIKDRRKNWEWYDWEPVDMFSLVINAFFVGSILVYFLFTKSVFFFEEVRHPHSIFMLNPQMHTPAGSTAFLTKVPELKEQFKKHPIGISVENLPNPQTRVYFPLPVAPSLQEKMLGKGTVPEVLRFKKGKEAKVSFTDEAFQSIGGKVYNEVPRWFANLLGWKPPVPQTGIIKQHEMAGALDKHGLLINSPSVRTPNYQHRQQTLNKITEAYESGQFTSWQKIVLRKFPEYSIATDDSLKTYHKVKKKPSDWVKFLKKLPLQEYWRDPIINFEKKRLAAEYYVKRNYLYEDPDLLNTPNNLALKHAEWRENFLEKKKGTKHKFIRWKRPNMRRFLDTLTFGLSDRVDYFKSVWHKQMIYKPTGLPKLLTFDNFEKAKEGAMEKKDWTRLIHLYIKGAYTSLQYAEAWLRLYRPIDYLFNWIYPTKYNSNTGWSDRFYAYLYDNLAIFENIMPKPFREEYSINLNSYGGSHPFYNRKRAAPPTDRDFYTSTIFPLVDYKVKRRYCSVMFQPVDCLKLWGATTGFQEDRWLFSFWPKSLYIWSDPGFKYRLLDWQDQFRMYIKKFAAGISNSIKIYGKNPLLHYYINRGVGSSNKSDLATWGYIWKTSYYSAPFFTWFWAKNYTFYQDDFKSASALYENYQAAFGSLSAYHFMNQPHFNFYDLFRAYLPWLNLYYNDNLLNNSDFTPLEILESRSFDIQKILNWKTYNFKKAKGWSGLWNQFVDSFKMPTPVPKYDYNVRYFQNFPGYNNYIDRFEPRIRDVVPTAPYLSAGIEVTPYEDSANPYVHNPFEAAEVNFLAKRYASLSKAGLNPFSNGKSLNLLILNKALFNLSKVFDLDKIVALANDSYYGKPNGFISLKPKDWFYSLCQTNFQKQAFLNQTFYRDRAWAYPYVSDSYISNNEFIESSSSYYFDNYRSLLQSQRVLHSYNSFGSPNFYDSTFFNKFYSFYYVSSFSEKGRFCRQIMSLIPKGLPKSLDNYKDLVAYYLEQEVKKVHHLPKLQGYLSKIFGETFGNVFESYAAQVAPDYFRSPWYGSDWKTVLAVGKELAQKELASGKVNLATYQGWVRHFQDIEANLFLLTKLKLPLPEVPSHFKELLRLTNERPRLSNKLYRFLVDYHSIKETYQALKVGFVDDLTKNPISFTDYHDRLIKVQYNKIGAAHTHLSTYGPSQEGYLFFIDRYAPKYSGYYKTSYWTPSTSFYWRKGFLIWDLTHGLNHHNLRYDRMPTSLTNLDKVAEYKSYLSLS